MCPADTPSPANDTPANSGQTRTCSDFKSRSHPVHRRRTDREPLDPRFALTCGNTVFSGSSATGAGTRSGNRPMMRASFHDPVSGRRPDPGRIDGGPGREPPGPPGVTPGVCGVASHTTQNRKDPAPARVLDVMRHHKCGAKAIRGPDSLHAMQPGFV